MANIIKENISPDNKLENRWNKKYFIEEIKQRDLISRNNKNVRTASNYPYQLQILDSATAGCSNLCFVSLFRIPTNTGCSWVELKTSATAI